MGYSNLKLLYPYNIGGGKNMENDLSINSIMYKAHSNAVKKGFWDKEQSFLESIALIHSELSEAVEDFREGKKLNHLEYESNGKPTGIPSEIADAVIRICDLCAFHNIDLEYAIKKKMAYNETRQRMHGKII